ncbi:MAG: hypothetical protein KDB21_13835, partial [Acidimicrobiales bacterium]|nr:hypothetical protein [Acidimicrobiales bacterium]
RVDCLDAVALETTNWSVTPLTIDRAESTYFDDAARFPRGSIALDHALLMRDIHHTWHPRPPLRLRHARATTG